MLREACSKMHNNTLGGIYPQSCLSLSPVLKCDSLKPQFYLIVVVVVVATLNLRFNEEEKKLNNGKKWKQWRLILAVKILSSVRLSEVDLRQLDDHI